jgi:hypothetical protein
VANRRGNPNWTKPPTFSAVAPTGASAFEHLVATLRLAPEEYANSTVLRDWVRKNKDHRYVPSELLGAWGLRVDSGA